MSSKKEDFNKNQIGDYILNEELGYGAFAKVVVGIHIPTGEKVAIKILDKNKLKSDPLAFKRVLLEISILKNIRHKNIIKLYEVMETPQKLYLIMEYCNGGELFNYIIRKKHLSEKQSCKFFHEIIDALEYLHIQNIVHRDIKPQNILLDISNNEITLKIIDFGISNIYSLDNLLESSCGTASYAPPEMHVGNKYFGLLTDIWSAGVVLYIMNFGYLPFCEDDENKNINNIIYGKYEIPKEASPELNDLLKHLLDINPLTRYDFEQIKKHPWFNIVSSESSRPGIIIGFNKIPVDENIINLCHEYGYDKKLVRQSVINNDYNSNSSIYYILLQKLKKKGIQSVSDLYSEKYLEFINDPNNTLINEQNGKNNENQKKINNKNNESKKEKSIEKKILNNKEKNKNNEKKSNNILNHSSAEKKNNKKKIKNIIKKEKNMKTNNDNEIFMNRNKIKLSKKNVSLKENNITKTIKNINSISPIEKRVHPIKSSLYHSNTNIIIKTVNTFKDYQIKEKLNNSFHEKLSDNIKEKILKLLNPKKKDRNKTKIKEELYNLKYKIKNGRSFNNNKSYNKKASKNNKNMKKMNFSKKIYDTLFKKDSEQITIIKNRNASAENDRRRMREKNRKSKDKITCKINKYNRRLSLSPINTNKKISNINTINIHKINLSEKKNDNNNNNNNNNLITKRNNMSTIVTEDSDLHINNNGYKSKKSKNAINIKVSKIIKNKNQQNKAKIIPQMLKIKKINGNDYTKNNKNNCSNNGGKVKNNNNYNTNNCEFNENIIRDCFTSRKEKESYNSFYKINQPDKKANFLYNSFNKSSKPTKKTIRITLKSIKENNKSNIMIYDNNFSKNNKYKDILLSINLSQTNSEIKNNSVYYRKTTTKKRMENKNKKNQDNLIKKDSTMNAKMLKIKSMRNASVIINKINKEDNTPKKRLMNISSFKYRNNKSIAKVNNPKIYTGPIDLKNIIISDTIKTVSDEIYNILNKNKIKQLRLNTYQFCCNKNGEYFEIKIYKLSGNIKCNQKFGEFTKINDESKKYKSSVKSLIKQKLFYFTISNNKCNTSKFDPKTIQKIIYKKFKLNHF